MPGIWPTVLNRAVNPYRKKKDDGCWIKRLCEVVRVEEGVAHFHKEKGER